MSLPPPMPTMRRGRAAPKRAVAAADAAARTMCRLTAMSTPADVGSATKRVPGPSGDRAKCRRGRWSWARIWAERRCCCDTTMRPAAGSAWSRGARSCAGDRLLALPRVPAEDHAGVGRASGYVGRHAGGDADGGASVPADGLPAADANVPAIEVRLWPDDSDQHVDGRNQIARGSWDRASAMRGWRGTRRWRSRWSGSTCRGTIRADAGAGDRAVVRAGRRRGVAGCGRREDDRQRVAVDDRRRARRRRSWPMRRRRIGSTRNRSGQLSEQRYAAPVDREHAGVGPAGRHSAAGIVSRQRSGRK